MFTRMRLRTLLLLASACMMLAPSAALAARGVVTAGTIVLRAEADLSSKKLFTIYKGSKVDVHAESGDWYRVTYGKYTGYVMKQHVSVSGEIVSDGVLRPGDSGSEVKALQELLRKRGYYNGAIDGEYGSGTERAVRYFQDDAGLTVDGKAGEKTLAALKSSIPSDDNDEDSDDGVLRPGDSGSDVKTLQELLRKRGYYNGSIDGEYGSGTERAVRYFQDDAGLTVDGKAGEKTLAALEKGDVTREDDGALRPGDSSSEVRALQELLRKHGYYSGAIDGEYGAATKHAVDAFQHDAGLTRDGIAGEKTLAALQKHTSTESLDWFTNGSSAIPKGAVFTVKDVLTGKTFRLRRWSGVNHADSEPLTAEDTATLKAIYGGNWSWRRRAILVSYNGHVYAASMNGMPHGDDTISANNFAGHICIHFTGSKTHGTKKVDADHQNAVRQALNASW